MMKIFDFLLSALLPSLILLHLFVAPYTKVEESFNLQATHDILTYGVPTSNISSRLRATYDHFDFPGAVPRSFIGAAVLAGASQPLLSLVGQQYGQLAVRAVLGLFNAFALLRYGSGVDRAFGKGTGRWYRLLQAGQFHVMYYASRTLPNMFAFGLSTLALREVLPIPPPPGKGDAFLKRHRLAVYLLVLAGVIFRSEIAILLAAQILYLLLLPATTLQTIIPAGLRSTLIALAISLPIDSFFWQKPIWPEMSGFIYNVIHGEATNWGTSPFHTYFTSFLPKLLLDPLIPTLLIPLSLYLPSTRRAALGLVIPSLVFVSIYSLQPHKEPRFIIYTLPPLTASAALSANYIFTRRSKSTLYALLSLALIASLLATFAASTFMLTVSSLNYPGGVALHSLHQRVSSDPDAPPVVRVHMDVLSCMTGVSRFQQEFPTPPFSSYFTPQDGNSTVFSSRAKRPVKWSYSKEENSTLLHSPEFWAQFDYVLTETPELAIGKWEIVETIYGYAGMEVLRPGSGPKPDRGDPEGVAVALEIAEWKDLRMHRKYEGFREQFRKYTNGWWIGPRMEAKIRILKRNPI